MDGDVHAPYFPLPVKPLLFSHLLCLLILSGCAQQDVAISRSNIDEILNKRSQPEPFQISNIPDKEGAFRLERKADIVVDLTSDGLMDINVTERHENDYGRNPIRYHSDQLIRFFDLQRRKDLVVVCFHKQAWPEELLKQRIESTNQYFFDRGYQRVVIQQYYAFGRGTHSDRRKPVF